jgi:protein-S-isoprenylcysteine O-methyltransferase Ste14/NAD(P)H-dependent FMN reductase
MRTDSKGLRVAAIVGSYRKGGITDQAVDALLASAREEGMETEKIWLVDRHIEFCLNCRTCNQIPGPARGQCVIEDEIRSILDTIERSDAIVLASPVNFYSVTAVMKRFIERLVCLAWWPWGAMYPKRRNSTVGKRAVVIAASAAPAWVGRWMTGTVGLMKRCAKWLGAETVGTLFVGLSARQASQQLPERARERARQLGRKLAADSAAASGVRRPRTIPPLHLLCAAAFAAACAYGLPSLSFGGVWALWAGGLLFAAGFWLMTQTYRLMQRRGTTHQFDTTTRLIEEGVFRRSRNPMYLGMTLMLTGACLALRNLAGLAAPLYFIIMVDRVFVPYEERKLEKEVGASYLSYQTRVRRWL